MHMLQEILGVKQNRPRNWSKLPVKSEPLSLWARQDAVERKPKNG